MVSSLSSVPPVWPKLRPLIMGIAIPAAAINGPKIMETLSPTPPVLCLSATYLFKKVKSIFSPESIMLSVRAKISFLVIPFLYIAFNNFVISLSDICWWEYSQMICFKSLAGISCLFFFIRTISFGSIIVFQ